MDTVELQLIETEGEIPCMAFVRASRFLLYQETAEQAELMAEFAIQCTRFGWPLNWIGYGREDEIPVLVFNKKPDGTVYYNVVHWVKRNPPDVEVVRTPPVEPLEPVKPTK